MSANKILKLLCCFKKPGVINLSYIHVLIEAKPTLFVVWEIKNVWSVKLIPLKRTYYTSHQAVVLSVPENQNLVILKASNFWRKINIPLALCAVELDKQATRQLINGFRPLNKVEIIAPLIFGVRNQIAFRPLSIQQRNAGIKNINRFNIHIQPSNYP